MRLKLGRVLISSFGKKFIFRQVVVEVLCKIGALLKNNFFQKIHSLQKLVMFCPLNYFNGRYNTHRLTFTQF